ncbi:MAG: diguanylate cyclase domain-containing protein [Acidimicrobiales bacterium]
MVGLVATVSMMCVIPVVVYVGAIPVDWTVIWVAFAATGAVSGVMAALPAGRLGGHRSGQRVLYLASLVDIGAIGAVVAVTGGERSWFWVVFALTTIFFSTGYPFGGQLVLLVATLTTYLAAAAAAGSDLGTVGTGWQMVVLVATFVLASFPSTELQRRTAQHEHARREADHLAARLEQRERWWRALVEHTSDPIVVFDETRHIVFASPAFEALLGFTPDEAIASHLAEVVHPDDLADLRVAAMEVDRDRPSTQSLCRLRHKGGEWRHVEVSFAAVPDIVEGSVVANLHDVTKRVEAEAALSHEATHDQLTGLANSRAFYGALDTSLAVARRQGSHLALLLFDLDRFKEANDTFGHAFGDQLLIGVARRLESTLRGADIIARLGGDEFTAVLTTDADPIGAAAAARRVCQALGETMVVAEQPVSLKVSVGVACWPDHGQVASEVLRSADEAMYRAKRSGCGVSFFDLTPPLAPSLVPSLVPADQPAPQPPATPIPAIPLPAPEAAR